MRIESVTSKNGCLEVAQLRAVGFNRRNRLFSTDCDESFLGEYLVINHFVFGGEEAHLTVLLSRIIRREAPRHRRHLAMEFAEKSSSLLYMVSRPMQVTRILTILVFLSSSAGLAEASC